MDKLGQVGRNMDQRSTLLSLHCSLIQANNLLDLLIPRSHLAHMIEAIPIMESKSDNQITILYNNKAMDRMIYK